MSQLSSGRKSRLAGWLYLIVVVTGFFSLAYVPGQVFAPGDAHATAANIATRDALFRWGIASYVLEQVAFLLLALELHRVFRATNRAAAALMAVLVAISVPFALACCMHLLDAMSWATGAGMARAFDGSQSDAMVAHSIDAYRNGLTLVGVFWGLWLLPLGWLMAKSRQMPRFLAVLVAAGGIGYLVDTACELLWPGYRASAIADYALLPAALGEIGTCFWLLVFGIRRSTD
jgi:hypothetical protein